MRKGIKILGKVLSAAVLLLIILPLALSLLLDIPAVQNYVVQKAVRMASKKLETTVSIDRVDIGLFSRVKIKGFYVEDYQRDTLLYVGRLDAFVTGLGIFGGGLSLNGDNLPVLDADISAENDLHPGVHGHGCDIGNEGVQIGTLPFV